MRQLFWAFRCLLVLLLFARVDTVSAQSGQPAVNPPQSDLIASWVVTVADEPRQRSLIIRGVATGTNGAFLLDATYGWLDGKRSPIRGEMTQSGTERRLELVTPADSKIVAKQLTDGSFTGTFTSKNGVVKPVKLERLESVAVNSATAAAANHAAAPTTPPNIHMVVMGGNDCPPCVAWRGLELPKLQQTAAFKAIRFSYVSKAVTSPVPSSMFLPDEVKPYKAKLDEASSGRNGSPQVAIIVNGEIYDYYFGTRSAKKVEQMILAIKEGRNYPFKRCLKLDRSRQCAVPA
ncbi:hypothetical protein SAMN05216344_104225 [Polaromonas sp. OV174]|uniref:hypothetical protein n=1 Tax=Polaromonas sp. OV174 TaxID=1855300 RepID=UPI0008E07BC2|nr:hypothetical protein [Polaromonas sp. OV174]SFB86850.1 hypothetical protein SAMN05216344_104225 [Polaromonas sp. OV174]